jgi:ABC-type proline/glycine betaine transport system ATPase subunit
LEVTAIYVTHDQAEAFALGDRVTIMREGQVVQHGTADELWAHPADEDTARFLGLGNVRDGTVIRPEAITARRVQAGQSGDGFVESARRHGPTVHLTVRLDDGSALDAAVTALDHPASGDRVVLEIDAAGIVRL